MIVVISSFVDGIILEVCGTRLHKTKSDLFVCRIDPLFRLNLLPTSPTHNFTVYERAKSFATMISLKCISSNMASAVVILILLLTTNRVQVGVEAFTSPPTNTMNRHYHKTSSITTLNSKNDNAGGAAAAAALATTLGTASLFLDPDSANAAISGGRMGGTFPPPQPPAIVRSARPSRSRYYSTGRRPRVIISPSIGIGIGGGVSAPYYYGPSPYVRPVVPMGVVPYGYNPYGISPFVPYGGYPFGRPGIGIGLRFGL